MIVAGTPREHVQSHRAPRDGARFEYAQFVRAFISSLVRSIYLRISPKHIFA